MGKCTDRLSRPFLLDGMAMAKLALGRVQFVQANWSFRPESNSSLSWLGVFFAGPMQSSISARLWRHLSVAAGEGQLRGEVGHSVCTSRGYPTVDPLKCQLTHRTVVAQ